MRILFLFSIVEFLSCKKGTVDGESWLKAEVKYSRDISCGNTILHFADDSMAVRSITGTVDLVYVVREFPARQNIIGNRIWVKARKIRDEEWFICNALGPAYAAIVVTDVRTR